MRDPYPGIGLLLAVCVLAGCSKSVPIGTVKGRVTLDGQPVSQAAISFDNHAAGVAVSANLNAQGEYVIRTAKDNGLPPGEYRVAVSPATIGDGESPLLREPSHSPASQPTPVPSRYHATSTSGLSARVEAGENAPYNFDLTTAE